MCSYTKKLLYKIFKYENVKVRFTGNRINMLKQALAYINKYNLHKDQWVKTSSQDLTYHYTIITNIITNAITISSNIINYLEIGGGDGKVMYLNILKLIKEFNMCVYVYNLDLKNQCCEFILDLMRDHPMIIYTYVDNTDSLPHITLCVAKNSMHHINTIEDILQNIQMDYMLIREHDVDTIHHYNIIAMEHFIYHMFEYTIDTPIQIALAIYVKNTRILDNYQSRDYWTNILSNTNMTSVWNNAYKLNNNHNLNRTYAELFARTL